MGQRSRRRILPTALSTIEGSIVRERTITIAQQEIAYAESEGTGRAVVLVHGNSSSSRVWRPLMEGPFGKRYRCLALDLPGHGRSARHERPEDYSIRSYASLLAAFATALDAGNAVVAGWSLGGHIVLEAASRLPEAAGFFLFGAPPVGGLADFGTAFLPNPAVQTGFTGDVDAATALSYAQSFLAPGSDVPTAELVADILATDGAARVGLWACLGSGDFTDEVEIVARLTQPLAVVQGEGEQLVSLDYLRAVAAPSLWRGEVQVMTGAGHAPHVEAPADFAGVLGQFVADVAP